MAFFDFQGKKIFYKEYGKGAPLLLLHGNSLSSAMFTSAAEELQKHYKVILMDFLGNGKSDRINRISKDLWYDEALQAIALMEYRNYPQVYLLGSSGGALAALNVALERPDMVKKVVADSFEGEYPLDSFAANLRQDRELSKQNPWLRDLYMKNHGTDWETVVDNDTQAICRHYQTHRSFFHKSLCELETPVLMTGSREDEFMPADFFEKTYGQIPLPNKTIHIFEKGGHPAILSNQEAFIPVVLEFFREDL